MNVSEQIVLFAKALTDYQEKVQPGYYAPVTVETGKRYARIVNRYAKGEGGSVYCFIDLTNGDILKAASWKAPAKGARGNIFNTDYDVGDGKPCDMYGSGMYKR